MPDNAAVPAAVPESAAAPGPDAATRARLDAAVDELAAGTRTWAALTLSQRATLLRGVRAAVTAVAEEWATTAAASKGLDTRHPLRGEEWLAGPYAVLVALDAYARTLDDLAAGRSPVRRARTRRVVGDRVAVDTSPLDAIDAVLLSGYTTEVWLTPGVSPRLAHERAGLAQREPTEIGGVGLVLGAGNVTSIPVLDVLYELLAAGRVALLKINPTQDALAPVFTRALAPLIALGLVRLVRGGGDVGAYLTRHPGIAHVHITGSGDTFAAIAPGLEVPITAELGGVSPIVVVPGAWTAADLRYQAEHVATMRLQNAGHNCIAGQVVLISRDWPQRDAFVAELRRALASAPARPTWYPRSDERLASARADYPGGEVCGGDRMLVQATGAAATALQTTEYFAPVLGVVDLPGAGMDFLDAAVAHANDELVGTLGANLLVDPATQRALGTGLEHAIARLRYGTVAVNAWTALGFLTPTATWGAYPGGTTQHAPSGIGVVHNALLLDDVERTVVRGPFRPFPRSLTGGRFSVLPKPPWFVSARTGAVVSEGLTRFRMDGRLPDLVRTLLRAYRA